jgi:WD40 repeat protein
MDMESKSNLLTLKTEVSKPESLVYSRNEAFIALTSMSQGISVWDAQAGEKLYHLDGGKKSSAYGIAFSHDSSRIATISSEGITIAQAQTGKAISQIRVSLPAPAVIQFGPDDKSIVCGDANGVIQVFNAETGKLRRDITGNAGSIKWVAYSEDGTKLIYFADQTVNIVACE